MERLKQSSYTAKTDHLRRLLDKTRKVGDSRKTRKTWLDIFHFLGQLLWTLGVFGQLLWNLADISERFLQSFLGTPTSNWPAPEPLIELESPDVTLFCLACWVRGVLGLLENDETAMWSPSYYGVTSRHLAKWSFLLSLTSLWWNPKFKEGYRGYHRHIEGFYDWYKYQALLLTARGLFWLMINNGLFDRVDPSAAVGVHMFMLGFTITVCIFGPKPSLESSNLVTGYNCGA